MVYICNIDFSSAENRGSENMVPALKEPNWVLETCKQADKSHFMCRRNIVAVQLQPYGLQHIRPPCPSLSPGVCSNPCPLSWLCHATISSSVISFSCLQSFPASRSFPVSQLFASRGQNIGTLASASVLLMNIQDWFPLRLSGLISLQSKGLSRVFSNTTVQKHQFFGAQPFYCPALTSIHDYWKNHSFDYMDLCWQSDVSAF